ncbi:hypothetical protein [Intestinimonas butyriciproducens]|uniref:hypothetical protein n=1 Tax=Intestinimonas butyriciproducens TaxID=1297617 RepID=UPI0031B5B448
MELRGNRPKRHPEYYAISAYQILARKTDEEMAKAVGIKTRTYQEKIKGWADFTVQEGDILARELGRTRDELFVT